MYSVCKDNDSSHEKFFFFFFIFLFFIFIVLELYYKETRSWKAWLDDENEYVADLSKVPEDKKKILDMGEFGIDGTFRKLELD